MGKVAIFSLPFYSHVKPSLSLVTELIARGEEVIYYSDESLREELSGYDVIFRSYGDMQGLFTNNDPGIYLSDPKKMLEYLVPGVINKSKIVMNAILPQIMSDPPDYILRDCDAFWGKLIGELLDIPVACYMLTFAINEEMLKRDIHFTMQQVFKIRTSETEIPVSIEELTHIAGTIAMEKYHIPGFSLIDAFSGNESLNLVYASKAFQPHASVFDNQFVFMGPQFPDIEPSYFQFPYIPNPKMDSARQKPLIYISFGSIYTDRPEFYQKCMEAFGDSDVDVIMSVGKHMDINVLGKIPSNIKVFNFVDQIKILEEATIFISHAGYNSVCESLVFGVPMILFPQGADQFAIASRLEELEAGVYIRDMELSIEQLREVTLDAMHDEHMKQRAETLRQSFMDRTGIKDGIDALLAYVEN